MTSEKVKTWFRKYWPWLAGAAGLIVLYLVIVNRQQNAAAQTAGVTTTTSNAPTSAEISAAAGVESAQIAANQKAASDTLAAETAQLQATLAAQTAQATSGNQLAAAQAQYQANVLTAQAQYGSANTRSLYGLIGTALPQVLSAFRPSPAPPGAGGANAPNLTGAATGGTAGEQVGIPIPGGAFATPDVVPVDLTQASTVTLPTPTFDSQGPPLEAFAPAVGGVSMDTGFGF